jgi:hypothetical protein
MRIILGLMKISISKQNHFDTSILTGATLTNFAKLMTFSIFKFRGLYSIN